MAFAIYRDGAWKQLTSAHVRVAGEWKRVLAIHSREAGNWRSIWRDTFTMVIASNIDDGVNLRDRAIAAGWDQASKLSVTINSGVRISKNGNDAMIIAGSFPRGVELRNYGQIIGKAGRGGNGGSSHGNAERGHDGWGGMTALAVGCPVTIFNHGIIAGGGGGGGGGEGGLGHSNPGNPNWRAARGGGGGGGGGRSNSHWSEAGAGGAASGGTDIGAANGNGGGWGTPDGPGGGGGGGSASYIAFGTLTAVGGGGGSGGGWGQGGHNGGGAVYASGNNPGSLQRPGAGNGGASGLAVYGNHHITWGATGERYGPIVNT